MSSYWSTAFDGTECIEYSLERMYVCMDIRIDNTNTWTPKHKFCIRLFPFYDS